MSSVHTFHLGPQENPAGYSATDRSRVQMLRQRINVTRWLAMAALCAALLLGTALSVKSASTQDPAAEVLTNEAIIKMGEMKLGDGLIISKIKTSNCNFRTGIDDMMKLKASGVTDAVIQAMVEASAPKSAVAIEAKNPAPPDPNDPHSPHDAGVYWLPKEKRANDMLQLEPTVYSGGKSGGVFGSAMTYGIHKAKWKAVVRGGRANLRISEEKPEFWFYFEAKSHGLSQSGYWGGASSPNEFVLAKLSAKKDERELIVGQFGAFGASTGTQSKDTVALKIEKFAAGVYRVVPEEPMRPGEYCFFYAGGAAAMGQSGGKLFDLGIDPAK